MLGEGSEMGDKCSVKRSVIGRHCRIGSNVKVLYILHYTGQVFGVKDVFFIKIFN